MNVKAWSYDLFIEPLVAGLKRGVADRIHAGALVIDIACGPGSMAMSMAARARHVTGIDLDMDLIRYATERAGKYKIDNISFIVHDAADLSGFSDSQFDIAVTSMAIHQFSEELAVQLLGEMKRISSKVIIADYNYPMPHGLSRTVAYSIERMAGGDHYRNFLNYMSRGGLKWFTDSAALFIKSTSVRSSGVFLIAECE